MNHLRSYDSEFCTEARIVSNASLPTSTLIGVDNAFSFGSFSLDGGGRSTATLTKSLMPVLLPAVNLPNAIALSSPSPKMSVLCAGHGTGTPLLDGVCSFGTSIVSSGVSVVGAMLLATSTFSVDTKISKLCLANTLDGTEMVL